MRILIQIVGLLTLINIAAAQSTRIEKTNVTTPEQDSKANSDKVPDVYALTGQFDRVVVLRFKNKADLLAGMELMVKQEKIRNGVILSGIGSVTGYQYHTVSNSTFPSKDIYVKNPADPADITSVNGYIIDGRVHAHITLANPDKVFGGHLEPGTSVFTFAAVTIGVFKDGIDLSHVDDKNYR